ncbi:MAG: methyltransferase domain-containing protein [Magnetococcales bacterium]|nr:methyltransferase domain-containing protein [Magnetococcales bacterium]
MSDPSFDASHTVCRICQGTTLEPLLDFGSQPIAHRLLNNPDDPEECFRLSVDLCPACGLIQNRRPIDPEILYRDYNYCLSSWKAQPHILDEIALIREHGRGGSVFEVGCNDGLFLAQLSQAGFAPVTGVEPNTVAGAMAREKGFAIYSSMLTTQVCQEAVREYGMFHVVVIRQVLEHLPDLHHAFDRMESLLAEDGLLLIEIPDFDRGLDQGDCSVLWEEHVNFFTEPVIHRLLTMRGFEPLAWRRYDFSGGALTVLARRGRSLPVSDLRAGPSLERGLAFAEQVRRYGHELRMTLERWRGAGGRVVLYGTGGRACTVVNGLELGAFIDMSVDDQRERQNKFMPGSRLPIREPQAMTGLEKALLVLLAVNCENEAQVMSKVTALCGEVQFLSLFSPNDIQGDLDRLARRMDQKG